ncbi:hypothetical protein, partial [Rhodococcus zopfii]|uniref:hypothetical protein n=1 Tax=Rhodococcus zopfii TaxID=43772 RepID=UPI001EDFE1C7
MGRHGDEGTGPQRSDEYPDVGATEGCKTVSSAKASLMPMAVSTRQLPGGGRSRLGASLAAFPLPLLHSGYVCLLPFLVLALVLRFGLVEYGAGFGALLG